MVVSKRSTTTQAVQPKGGSATRGAVRAGETAGIESIARTFKPDAQQRISLMELMTRIRIAGIEPDDPRIREIVADLPAADGHGGGGLSMEQFSAVCEASGGLIARALRGDLVVPDFPRLQSELQNLYASVRTEDGGRLHSAAQASRSGEVRIRGLHGRRTAFQRG
jgi:glutaminase